MLEQTDAAVAGLINKFSAITPELMNTFKNQIQVDIIYNFIGLSIGIVLLMLGIIGLICSIKFVKSQEGTAFGIMFSAVAIIVGIGVIITAALVLVQLNLNPDYYIIEHYIKPLIS